MTARSLVEFVERIDSVLVAVLGRLWCVLMSVLDRYRWCTVAYERALAHCWLHIVHCIIDRDLKLSSLWPQLRDLVLLPYFMVRCGTYSRGKWCIRCRN